MPFALPPIASALAGLAVLALLLGVTARNLQRGLVLFVLLGWLPFTIVPLAGGTITTGLGIAHLYATALVPLWLLRWRTRGDRLLATGAEYALAVLVLVALVSTLAGFTAVDPGVDARNVRLDVAVGQLLLWLWPLALVVVARAAFSQAADAWRLVAPLVALAPLALLVPVLPASFDGLFGWAQYFALFASPFALVRALDGRGAAARTWAALAWLAPLAVGLWAGRAFFYGTWVVATAIVVTGRLGRRAAIVLPLGAAAVFLWLAWQTPGSLPTPIGALVASEQAQQSLGGRSGRWALWEDAVRIWARHPALGVGPGNAWPYMHRYSVLDTPHSQYVNLLLELGPLGLAAMLAFILLALRLALGARARAPARDARAFFLAWAAGFSGLALGSVVGDFMLHSIRNAGLELFAQFHPQWVLLGAMSGVAEPYLRHSRREARWVARTPAETAEGAEV